MKNKNGRYHVYASWTGIVDTYASLDAATRRAAKITAAPRCGRGVVVDSVPEHEDLECHNKAKALLSAVPAAERMTAQRRAAAAAGGAVAGSQEDAS